MSVIDTLIFDRTQADVDRVKELNSKALSGTLTNAERMEWDEDMKGAYNSRDINRVSNAVRFIAKKLVALPDELDAYRVSKEVYKNAAFELPYEVADVVVSPKSGWAMTDYMTQTAMHTYLSDIATLRGILALPAETPAAPAIGQGITYRIANDIEKILFDVHDAFVHLEESMYGRIDRAADAGTNWSKFECTRVPHTYKAALESGWTLMQSGPVVGDTKEITGYNSFELKYVEPQFVYVGIYGETTVSRGVVYIIKSDTTVERHSLYYVGDVQYWDVHTKTVSTIEQTGYWYRKGEYIQTINTKGYALPDDQYKQEAVTERDEDGILEFVRVDTSTGQFYLYSRNQTMDWAILDAAILDQMILE